MHSSEEQLPLALMFQKPPLALDSAAVTGERAIRSDDAMAGKHDCDGVGAIGQTYSADR